MATEPWVALSEDILKGYLSGEELDAFRHSGLAPGDADPVASLITSVTNFVRSYILQCPRYKLGPDGTLPVILHDAACAILVMRVMNRVHGLVNDPDGVRRRAHQDAMKLLDDISQCEGPSVPLPVGEVGSEKRAPGIVPIAYNPPTSADGTPIRRQFGRWEQDGL